MVEVGVEASSDQVQQLLPRSLAVIHFEEDHLRELVRKCIILTGNLLAQEPELFGELFQEEWEQLLVVGLVHVVLPLGHVPGGSIGWHHIVWKHLKKMK